LIWDGFHERDLKNKNIIIHILEYAYFIYIKFDGNSINRTDFEEIKW